MHTFGPDFISRHLAMSISPSSSVRGQKVMLILLLSIQRPANFCSSIYLDSQPNRSFTNPKGKKKPSCEDIVPKRDKAFPFSSYLPKSLLTSEAPRVIVALNAFRFRSNFLPLSLLFSLCTYVESDIIELFLFSIIKKVVSGKSHCRSYYWVFLLLLSSVLF